MDKKSVVINKYCGGLGNQMFQYAFGLNMEKQGKRILADTSWYHGKNCFGDGFLLKKVFPYVLINRDENQVKTLNRYLAQRWITTRIANRIFPFTSKVYWEKNKFAYDVQALETSKKAVSGYWQCHRYVDNVSQELRRQFIFKYPLLPELQDLLDKIQYGNAVFLHIRGGDYIKDSKASRLYGNICTSDYYKKAIYIMKKKLQNPLFLVFTNDIEYAKSIVLEKKEMFFISDVINRKYEDWVDMMAMSQCKHAIIANSSFSWWGAWLIENPDKIVVAPQRWMNRKHNFDIWEPEWVRI